MITHLLLYYLAFQIFKEHAARALTLSPFGFTLGKNTPGHNDFAYSYLTWWSYAGSNRGPPACKAGALPAEL